ncbi:MAG: plasmid mobilization relaxosome protein MobC [Bacteroidota bacterium]
MSEQKKNRNKWLHIRLTETEYKKISTGFSQSTKRKLSEYARSILLNKPITVYTRNQSFDDFVTEIIFLKRELKAIGNNFNQAVKRLHTMDKDVEIKTWALLNENSKQIFFKKTEEINQKINQIVKAWSQE